MGLYRIKTTFSGGTGTPWVSLMFMFDVTSSSAIASAGNTAVGAFWGAVDANMKTNVTWATDGTVDELNTDGTLIASYSVTPVTGAGGQSDDSLPPATQANIRWETGQIVDGKRIRGHTYIPGLTEGSSNSGGQWNGGSVGGVTQTAINTLVAVTNPSLSVWSRKNAQSFDVTGGAVQSKFAVLRSRRD